VTVSWRVVVMVSGTGSNAEAFLDSVEKASPPLPLTVVAMGADREADGLEHAVLRGIPTFVVPLEGDTSRAEWGEGLIRILDSYAPDLIILSGFMRLLPPNVVDRYHPRIINTHPAFLPEFPGAHGVRDALAAGVDQTGASVIIVDNGVDTGPVLAQERVALLPGDDEHTLHERIKTVERRLLFATVQRIVSGDLPLTPHDPEGQSP
jgi:phosphoribosylglycinamide formyltransferase-1